MLASTGMVSGFWRHNAYGIPDDYMLTEFLRNSLQCLWNSRHSLQPWKKMRQAWYKFPDSCKIKAGWEGLGTRLGVTHVSNFQGAERA